MLIVSWYKVSFPCANISSIWTEVKFANRRRSVECAAYEEVRPGNERQHVCQMPDSSCQTEPCTRKTREMPLSAVSPLISVSNERHAAVHSFTSLLGHFVQSNGSILGILNVKSYGRNISRPFPPLPPPPPPRSCRIRETLARQHRVFNIHCRISA